jgi:hypothetical protein
MNNIFNWNEFITESKKIDPRAETRNRGDVIFDAKDDKVKDNKDHFPINNVAQGRNALARVNQYSTVPEWYEGNLEQLKNKVYKEVAKKYPSIEIDEDKKND